MRVLSVETAEGQGDGEAGTGEARRLARSNPYANRRAGNSKRTESYLRVVLGSILGILL